MPTKFQEKVYTILKQVPQGKITTYKALAQAINTKAYRAIGMAMKNNPYAPKVPCHRVIASNGNIGGFKGKTTGPAIQEKIILLKKEGIAIKNNKIIDFKKKLHIFQ